MIAEVVGVGFDLRCSVRHFAVRHFVNYFHSGPRFGHCLSFVVLAKLALNQQDLSLKLLLEDASLERAKGKPNLESGSDSCFGVPVELLFVEVWCSEGGRRLGYGWADFGAVDSGDSADFVDSGIANFEVAGSDLAGSDFAGSECAGSGFVNFDSASSCSANYDLGRYSGFVNFDLCFYFAGSLG